MLQSGRTTLCTEQVTVYEHTSNFPTIENPICSCETHFCLAEFKTQSLHDEVELVYFIRSLSAENSYHYNRYKFIEISRNELHIASMKEEGREKLRVQFPINYTWTEAGLEQLQSSNVYRVQLAFRVKAEADYYVMSKLSDYLMDRSFEEQLCHMKADWTTPPENLTCHLIDDPLKSHLQINCSFRKAKTHLHLLDYYEIKCVNLNSTYSYPESLEIVRPYYEVYSEDAVDLSQILDHCQSMPIYYGYVFEVRARGLFHNRGYGNESIVTVSSEKYKPRLTFDHLKNVTDFVVNSTLFTINLRLPCSAILSGKLNITGFRFYLVENSQKLLFPPKAVKFCAWHKFLYLEPHSGLVAWVTDNFDRPSSCSPYYDPWKR